MNILFIYSLNSIAATKPLQSCEGMQFGISYISSVLKKNGHTTELLVLSSLMGLSRKKTEEIDDYIESFNPELIGFTCVATEYAFISEVAHHIKTKYPDIYLVIGGPHASLNPEELLAGDFDALCIGEGEYAVLELVKQLQGDRKPSGIANMWLKGEGGGIEKNPQRPFLQDLDSLPFPDRDMWHKWIYNPESRYSILLGRGCPFKCAYCSNHALKKIAPGKYVRFRSPGNIIEELKATTKRFPGQKEVYLEVETVWIDKEWTLDLCGRLEAFNRTLETPLTFGVNIRVTPNADFERLFAVLRRSNFRFINIGLESGSERVRKEVLRRSYSNNDIIETARLARSYGLQVNTLNMIGFPGETPADFEETINVNRTCLPESSAISIFFPYPGTDLYFLCKEQGLLDKNIENECERSRAILDMPGFPARKIQKYYEWFDYYVYKGHEPLHRLLIKVLIKKLKSQPVSHYIMRRIVSNGWLTGIKEKLL